MECGQTVCQSELLSNVHCLTIGAEGSRGDEVVYRLSVVHCNIWGEVQYTKKNAEELKNRRFLPAAYNSQVTATLSSKPNGKDRHAEGLMMGKFTSLTKWVEWLYRVAKTGSGRVIITGRGNLQSLSEWKGKRKELSKPQIDAVFSRLFKLKRIAGEPSAEGGETGLLRGQVG